MTQRNGNGGRGAGTSRRSLLLGAGGLAATQLASSKLGMPYIGNAAAAEPIRIGMIWAKTGAIVDQSTFLAQGGLFAAEQRNNQLLGRPLEIIWLDEPNPQGAQLNAQRLIDEHKVCALIGGAQSSFALAISAVAKKAKIPYVAANAAALDLTGKLCNKYTFRLQPPVDVHTKVLAPYCMGLGKRWYTLTAAYAFGQDIKASFTDFNAKNGGTIVGADEVPVGTPDYSSFILKIRAAKPDVVVGGLSASDLTTFLKQWNELGMKGKIPFAEISIGNTDIWGVGPDAATGIYTMVWYYKNPANTEDDKAFTDAYMKKFNQPPPDKAWMGWFGMRSLLESIELAKSTEPAAIVKALETWHVKDGDLDVSYRDFDHQMKRRTIICKVKDKITDKWDYVDVLENAPKTVAEIDAAFGSAADSACKMDSL
ncbi:branched-chain amino acid transport system substrate-binding protein [Bosea sp. OAE752]|jgi:branched-chain amino acid transport system substrate-binding protein|uniref:ABC transporter substrate-binding protein n=1 Tax=unclassified Bosea (in: a-proteobacteria) TaxID=2653178 RepID=UPI00056F9442|nr:ABC transporter substrate-binding protein [Bosea sp. UNC402CLCol]